jgi:hypothetical protein
MKTNSVLTVSLLFAALGLNVHSLLGAQLNLDFHSASGTILDTNGLGTGFSARLSGTGTAQPTNDPRLVLNTTAGTLSLTTSATNEDFNGQAGISTAEAIGLQLSSLGYTGTQDFAVSTHFQPIRTDGLPGAIMNNDQAGVFVGQNSANLTRGGHITFSNAAEWFSGNTQNGTDINGHFFGFGLNVANGLSVTISRSGSTWQYIINGVNWAPNTAANGTGSPAPPTFLNSLSDLTVGVFGINVNNTDAVTYKMDSFNAVVETVPGDANGDGHVDLNDFNLISDNLFKNVTPGTNGDLTLDGVVNYNDFRLWKNNYHPGAGSSVPNFVPEPSSFVLSIFALLGILGGRRFLS